MNAYDKDRVEGMMDDAMGRGKIPAGDLAADTELRKEGAKDRMAGGVIRTAAEANDRIRNIAGKLSDKVNGS